MAKKEFYSRGKLLITGEYGVVNGAKALAIPTQLGQKLEVSIGRGSDIRWKSYDPDGNEWFQAKISLFDFSVMKTNEENIARRLTNILESAVRLNSDFLSTWKGIRVKTELEFPIEWGLGSSSTLIHNVAQWADVDPFDLYMMTFGGSGYDIACADAKGPIIYQRVAEDTIRMEKIKLPKDLLSKMYFVYTGRKAHSEKALEYIEAHPMSEEWLNQLTEITESLSGSGDLKVWLEGLTKHNRVLGEYLKRDAIPEEWADFPGALKPLGAWGGDFMLALSERSDEEVKTYFSQRGGKEVQNFTQLALS